MYLIFQLLVVLKLLLGAPLNVLVDGAHQLPAWYAPGLNDEAVAALENMQTLAESEGIKLSIFSAYRSFDEQTEVFAREENVNSDQTGFTVATAGYSEHQLGTTFDVVWPGLLPESKDLRNESLYGWMENRAHQFGFVLSYPLRTDPTWPYSNRFVPLITEFIYEPWHIRYVGFDLAREIHRSGYLDPTSRILPQEFYEPWP